MGKIKKLIGAKKINKLPLSIMPTIGLVGGCGVLAGVDIEKEIISAAQRLMFPVLDQDYLNILSYQYTQFHDRNDAVCFDGCSPYGQYMKCLKALESIGVQVFVLACNTAHAYIPDLEKGVKVPIIDMVQEVGKDTVSKFPAISKVGLLSTEATFKGKLYQNVFASHGVTVVVPSAFIRKQVMHAIYLIKSGVKSRLSVSKKSSSINKHPYKRVLAQNNELSSPVDLINNAVQYLSDKGCSHIILGCTELPLVIRKEKITVNKKRLNIINPNK